MGIFNDPEEVVAFADNNSAFASGAPYYFYRIFSGSAVYLHIILT